jgi:hypothetical protein
MPVGTSSKYHRLLLDEGGIDELRPRPTNEIRRSASIVDVNGHSELGVENKITLILRLTN